VFELFFRSFPSVVYRHLQATVLLCAAVFALSGEAWAMGSPCPEFRNWKNYRSDAVAFEHPAEWGVQRSSSGNVTRLVVQPPGDFDCGFVLTTRPVETEMSIEAVAAQYWSELVRLWPGATLHKQESARALDGWPAIKLLGSAPREGRLTQVFVFLVAHPRAIAEFVAVGLHPNDYTYAHFLRTADSLQLLAPVTAAADRQATVQYREFRNSALSFRYPASLKVVFQGQDQEMGDAFLVRLESNDRSQFAEVRYLRCIDASRCRIEVGQKLEGLAMNTFGRFYPMPEWPSETFPAGDVHTTWYPKSTSNRTGRELWLSAVWMRGDLAHLTFFNGPRATSSEARLEILRTLQFARATPTGPTALVGTWHTQGAQLALESDGTFKELIWGGGLNRTYGGRYEVRPTASPETGGRHGVLVLNYELPKKREELSYRLQGNKLIIVNNGHSIEYEIGGRITY
jgi:hypothetical protein